MLRGTCKLCGDYLVVDSELECINTHDKPDGRGKAYLYQSKKETKQMVCPDCHKIVSSIATDVCNKLSKKSKKK